MRLDARTEFEILERSPKGVETGRALAKRGSILVCETVLAVSPIRKAVVADRHNQADHHNPIPHVTSPAEL